MHEGAVIRKQVGFGALLIEYDERVLAPRPWTELQSRWAAELLSELPSGDVLELCAGPGHIGLLATKDTDRRLVQVDADPVGSAYARSNAQLAGRSDLVDVRTGVLEEALHPEERFALVIADPPWVPSADVANHPDDPTPSIDGGPDGLDLARTCLEVINRHLAPDGAALLQVGDAVQVSAVREHVGQRLPALHVHEHRPAHGGAVVLLRRSHPA